MMGPRAVMPYLCSHQYQLTYWFPPSYKPAPFFVLDEIDAALDDRNVERFANYLHNLSKNTQFIVITHRRGTMEASDVLYGVTMQEQGVSKLLRLDLNQMEQYLGIVE